MFPQIDGTKRSRGGARFLAVLVGVTLTLVCQGHIVGDHLTGPHLTILGDPEHAGNRGTGSTIASDTTAQEQGSMADMPGMSMLDMTGMYMPGMNEFALGPGPELLMEAPLTADDATSSPGGNLATAITNPPLESMALVTLSFALLLSLFQRDATFYLLEMAATALQRSQTSASPELPPPR